MLPLKPYALSGPPLTCHLWLRLGIRLGRRGFLVVFLVVLLILVDRVLPLGTLQLDGDLHRRLVDFVIFAEGLKSRRQYLYPQLAVRNAVEASLALGVGLEFKAAAVLLVMPAHRMHDHPRVAHRLSIDIL